MLHELCACDGCGNQIGCALRDAGGAFPEDADLAIRQEAFCADAPIAVDGDCLLAVKSGVVKSVCRDAHGQDRVVAFSFPGDLFGLEAAVDAEPADVRHGACVSMTTVCRIRLRPEAAKRLPPQFCARLSAELATRIRDNFQHRQLVADAAQVRMAHWLVQLMRAARGRHQGGAVSVLPAMARADIASYLHLRVETVSRVLSEFRKNGWVRGPLHRLEVCDAQALDQLAQGQGALHPPVAAQGALHG